MDNPVKIRLMQNSDLDSLSETYVEVYRVFDVGERWTKESAHKLLKYWLYRQPDLAFVAEYEDKIVGAFVAGIKPWWDGNHLVDGEIFVHPEYQKHRVGSELSKAMFRTAIEKYDAIVWDTYTFKGVDHPLSWYKSLGFEEIQEWTMISGNLKKALKILENRD